MFLVLLSASRIAVNAGLDPFSAGKANLTLPPIPVDPVQSRGVSPGQPSSHGPLSPPSPIEGFSWPDVRELRSRYSNGGRSQKGRMSRSSTILDHVSVGGLRRHSSGSPNRLDSDRVSSRKQRGGRFAGQDERAKRLQRANSLDPRLSLDQRSDLQRLQKRAGSCREAEAGYYVAAEAPLTDDPEHKIIIMEKLPEPERTAKESKEEDDCGYVQIRSPTSREKISIMAVIDRCRVYQESDDYRQREEAKGKGEQSKPPESIWTPAASPEQNDPQRTRSDSGQKAEGAQKSIVKNLREKFQSHS